MGAIFLNVIEELFAFDALLHFLKYSLVIADCGRSRGYSEWLHRWRECMCRHDPLWCINIQLNVYILVINNGNILKNWKRYKLKYANYQLNPLNAKTNLYRILWGITTSVQKMFALLISLCALASEAGRQAESEMWKECFYLCGINFSAHFYSVHLIISAYICTKMNNLSSRIRPKEDIVKED